METERAVMPGAEMLLALLPCPWRGEAARQRHPGQMRVTGRQRAVPEAAPAAGPAPSRLVSQRPPPLTQTHPATLTTIQSSLLHFIGLLYTILRTDTHKETHKEHTLLYTY